MNDLQKCSKIWREEGRIITCDSCITKISDIERVHSIRYKVGCQYDKCKKQGAYELEMRF